MQFIVDRDQILNPLSRVNTVVDRNPTIPILSQVLLTVDEDKTGIRLTGSNIEIEISEYIPDVEVSESGQVAFPGLTAQEFCRQLPKECRLKFDISGGAMNIYKLDDQGNPEEPAQSDDESSGESNGAGGGKSHLSLQTMMRDSLDGLFPILDAGEWDIQFQINRSDLRTIISRSQHAMGAADLRYYLNAMLFEISEKELRTVATDGHRMAVSHAEAATGLNDSMHRAIVPRKTVLDLNKLLTELSSPVTLEFNDNHIRMSTPNVKFTSKLLEGTYPDWRGAIPANLSCLFRAPRLELISVLRRVAILGPEVAISMEVNDGKLRVHAETTKNAQFKIDESLDIEQEGDALSFQVNGKYLLDIFEAMPEYDSVEFNLRNANTAALINFPRNESSSFLVMLLKDR